MIKNFIVHDEDGNILRAGKCPEGDIQLQALDGETVMEAATTNPRGQKVIKGQLQDNPQSGALKKHFQDTWRMKRDSLLAASDWTQLADAPLSDAKKRGWAIYRQSLRDMLETQKNARSIEDVIFPPTP